MTDLPITRLTSLQIQNPVDPITGNAITPTSGQGSLILGSMTMAQRIALVNNPNGIVGAAAGPNQPVLNGTIVYDSTLNVNYGMVNGAWVVGGGGGVSFVAVDGKAVQVGQLVTFSQDGNGTTITNAIGGNANPLIGKVKVAAPLRAHKLKASNDVNALPDLVGFTNLEILDFNDPEGITNVGLITLNELQFITFQVNDNDTTQQNILLTDDQTNTSPTLNSSGDFITMSEIRSSNQALAITNTENIIQGLSNIESSVIQMTAGGSQNSQFTSIILGKGNNDNADPFIILKPQSQQDVGTGNYVPSCYIRANTTMTEDVTFRLPVNGGTLGDVLTTDGNGNTSWANAGGVGSTISLTTINATGAPGTGGVFDGYGGTYLNVNGTLNIVSAAYAPTGVGQGGSNYGSVSYGPVLGSNIQTGIGCDTSVLAISYYANSSRNIKDIIDTNPIEEIINKLSRLNVVKYEHKDKNKHGFGSRYGVIAEEVNEILPSIINHHEGFIPNIMQSAEISFENPENIIILLDKRIKENFKGKKIQFFTENGTEVIGIVSQNINETINVKLNKEISEDIQNIYVYGSWENNPSVNKDQLFEMNIAVTQNLLKRIAVLEQKLAIGA